MERLVEEGDPEHEAREGVECHRGRHGDRERTGLQCGLLQPERSDADDHERVHVPVRENRSDTLVELRHRRLRERGSQPEQDAPRGSQQTGPQRRTAAACEHEEQNGNGDAGAADHRPGKKRSVVLAFRRLADDEQRCEPAGDERGADDLRPLDGPLLDQPPEWQREHDARNQERLHDDHAPDPESDRLSDEPQALHEEPEQPDGLTCEAGEESRSDRLGRLGRGGLLLQHEPEREEEGGHEREDDVHGPTLRVEHDAG